MLLPDPWPSPGNGPGLRLASGSHVKPNRWAVSAAPSPEGKGFPSATAAEAGTIVALVGLACSQDSQDLGGRRLQAAVLHGTQKQKPRSSDGGVPLSGAAGLERLHVEVGAPTLPDANIEPTALNRFWADRAKLGLSGLAQSDVHHQIAG